MSVFSVGDCIAVLKLFRDVAITVQEYSDAKDDYQRTIINLETLQSILECFDKISFKSRQIPVVNAIRGEAQKACVEIRQACASIERYRSKLGYGTSPELYRNAFARLQWSQMTTATTSRLAKASKAVEQSIQKIHLLLGLHTMYVTLSLTVRFFS